MLKAMGLTWLYTLPIMAVASLLGLVGYAVISGEPLSYQPLTFSAWVAGVIGAFLMIVCAGGVLSLIAVCILGPVAWLLMRRFGGGRIRDFAISLCVAVAGGMLGFYILFSRGDRLAEWLATLTLLNAPLYGLVFAQLVTRAQKVRQ